MFKRQQMKLTLTYTIILTLVLGLSNISIYVLFKQYNEYALSSEITRMLASIEDSEWLVGADDAAGGSGGSGDSDGSDGSDDSDGSDGSGDSEGSGDSGDSKESEDTKEDENEDSKDETEDKTEVESTTEAQTESSTEARVLNFEDLVVPRTIKSFDVYFVFDNSGSLRYKGSTDKGAPMADAVFSMQDQITLGASPQVFEPVILGNDDIALLVTAMPITLAGQQLGHFVVASDISLAQQTFSNLQRVLLGSFGLGLVFSAGVAYWYSGLALRPLQKAYEGQQDFLANASHELKTPLSVMLLSAEALEGETPEDAPIQRQLVQDLKDEALKMADQVNQLLFLAKADSGKLDDTFEKEQVNLSDLLEQEVERFQGLAQQKHLNLTTKIDPNIQKWGSKKQLISLCGILIENAIKYTPENGMVAVDLYLQGRGSRGAKPRVVLSVSDSGPGIDEDHRGRVFERYYRIDQARSATASSDVSGFGLGLSIAKQIATGHQGQIHIETSPWQGARFVVTF